MEAVAEIGLDFADNSGAGERASNGLRSWPLAVALGVSWSIGVDGQNLSILADLSTAEERENEEDFESRRRLCIDSEFADDSWFVEDSDADGDGKVEVVV